MSYDDDWPDQTMEHRRVAIKKTIRPASPDELKQMSEERFPIVTDPWCVKFEEFLRSHADAKFYRAEIGEDVQIVYCADTNQGVWFWSDKGMGKIQAEGLQMLGEIVKSL
jgi:hypothetical protein